MAENDWGAWEESWKQMHAVSAADESRMSAWQEEMLEDLQALIRTEGDGADTSEIAREAQLMDIVSRKPDIPKRVHRTLVQSLLDDMFRFGPLDPLWQREDVSDMQVFVPVDPRHPQIITFTDSKGRHVYDGRGFRDLRHAKLWLNRHLAQLGQHYDAGLEPSKDATFENGERLHVISRVCGYSRFQSGKYIRVPCLIITVRRFVHDFTLDMLTETGQNPFRLTKKAVDMAYSRKAIHTSYGGGMADRATMDYLRIMVRLGKNHLVAGGTGTGKVRRIGA